MMRESLRNRFILLGVILVGSLVLLAPTAFREQLTDWPFSSPLNLGLDLSGGVSLVYEVQTEEAVLSYLQVGANDVRSMLRNEKIPVVRAKATNDNKVYVLLYNDKTINKVQTLVEDEFPELSFSNRKDEGSRVGLYFGISSTFAEELKKRAVEQAVEALRSRVDKFGVAEPLIQKVGIRRVQLQMPGITDIERVKRVVGKTAKLEFRLLPQGPGPSVQLKDINGLPIRVEDQIMMTGDKVKDASVSIAPTGVEVLLTLTGQGAKSFGRITSENQGRNLAIILDGVVYSSPRINEPIPGGQASISGSFTPQEAKELSIILKAGALPATLKVLNESTVGPSLGKESIRSGILAIAGGFIAILLFMAWYYRQAGIVAIGTLVINILVLVATLSLFGATLTLPGLAGLALTIGIAVDSNIIIYERVRDELRNGVTHFAAIDNGFSKAFSAIIDMNLTALITGVILYIFGTGPVRGFAVTLSVGVITTIFGAVFVARLFFDYFSHKNKKLSF